MKTKDFLAALEAGFAQAYDNNAGFTSVPYIEDKETGRTGECMGVLLAKGEHFAVVVANAAHWIAQDPDNLWPDDVGIEDALDRLEDFHNLVSGMKTAPYMHWTCIYFPGLTEGQVLDSSEAFYDPEPDFVTDTQRSNDPLTGAPSTLLPNGE